MALLKNTTAGGVAVVPSAFKTEEVTITNKRGDAVDIQALVTDIAITESIYSPGLICTVSVKDEANIVGALPLYGLETLHIRISRIEGEDGPTQEIDLLFYVTEYPLYGRASRQHVQAWTVTGISPEIYHANFMKISRAYSKGPLDEIAKIAEDALKIQVKKRGKSNQKGQGVIRMQNPLQAIDWFLRRSSDKEGAPFYFYQSLDGVFHLDSHSELTKANVYRTYFHSRDYSTVPSSRKDYDQRKVRMVEVASDLNLAKYIESRYGAYASENTFIDPVTKKITRRYYDYSSDFPFKSTLEGTSTLEEPASSLGGSSSGGSSGGTIKPKPTDISPEKLPYSSAEFHALSKLAFSSPAYSEWGSEKLEILDAFPGVFNALVHDVTVFGDFTLGAGKKVELKFPAAADPGDGGVEYDKNLSGLYLVVSVTHKFSNQEYFTAFRAKRDSFSKA
jgi:hypothetical protein